MSKIVYILNGPNLKLLGQREPDIYGRDSLDDIKALCETACKQRGYALAFYQTNIEGELVDHVQEAGAKGAVLLINAAAYTHTSIALYDALKTLTIPVIEVHLSQVGKRESFRQISYVASAATGTISGFGAQSYVLAIGAALDALT